jgi:hypothetical protein
MHDINGKVLHIGSEIHSYVHGLCKIIGMQEEHNPDEGGAAIIVLPKGKTESVSLRTHNDKVVRVRTWKELAIEALQVQDACNLSGVVLSFATIISEVRTRLEDEGKGGTDNVNNHPVCRLYADKVAHLTGTQLFGNDEVAKAYVWAHDTKEGKVG